MGSCFVGGFILFGRVCLMVTKLEFKHIMVRAIVKNPLKDIDELKAWSLGVIDAVNMKLAEIPGEKNPIAWNCDIPGNEGMTLVAVIETSNLAYHDWKVDNGTMVELDLFSCGPFTTEQVIGEVMKLSPISLEYKFFDREHSLDLLDEGSMTF